MQRYPSCQGIIFSDSQPPILTCEYPEVLECIAYAERTAELPPDLHEDLFALAAQASWTKTDSVVHWLFWKLDQLDDTFALLHRVSAKQPPTIHSSVTITAALKPSLLLRHLRAASSPAMKSKSWYQRLIAPEAPPIEDIQTRSSTKRQSIIQDAAQNDASKKPKITETPSLVQRKAFRSNPSDLLIQSSRGRETSQSLASRPLPRPRSVSQISSSTLVASRASSVMSSVTVSATPKQNKRKFLEIIEVLELETASDRVTRSRSAAVEKLLNVAPTGRGKRPRRGVR
ncbi:hypothetical protein C8J56DRAFT_926714 [Mycena floridula]|nr:hypothetical protein C8J56DRAFT_926714 [Mycena floridula]